MNDELIQSRQDAPQDGALRDSVPVEKLIHLALPVRLTHMQMVDTARWSSRARMTSIRAARGCSARAR